MPSMETANQNQRLAQTDRSILLLCDHWNTAVEEGIASINRSLATELSQFKGVKVYCILLRHSNTMTKSDAEDAEKNNVTLIHPNGPPKDDSLKTLCEKFNENPLELFPHLRRQVPNVTHVIGHSPITAKAAIKIRDQLYVESVVMLFYHIMPDDLSWLGDTAPYVSPSNDELITMAQSVDVVYSVTERVKRYFAAKFLNHATSKIDHRLYLPVCSKNLFDIKRKPHKEEAPVKILTCTNGYGLEAWTGLDIAVCTANKVALASKKDPQSRKEHILVIGGVNEDSVKDLQKALEPYITSDSLKVEVHSYKEAKDLYKDLAECALCIYPIRSECLGQMALQALSAGIPTLISEDSSAARMIKSLSEDNEYFLVPVTQTTSVVRQDASVWKEKILSLMSDYSSAQELAGRLSLTLRRDEVAKETHDDVITCCLGGIRLQPHIHQLSLFIDEEEAIEIPIVHSLNNFIQQTLKQAWRLKHHPLTRKSDLHDLIPGIKIPVDEIITQVINKIEEFDRRIVGMESKSGAFVVYSPTPNALSDLWAMCDVIATRLHKVLFAGSLNRVTGKFGVKDISVRMLISGPDFLKYKKAIMNRSRPKTAAF